MAPLVHLFALLALATALLASPHISRNVYGHRAVARPALHLDSRSPISPPRRRRSLNKRCIPRPANSTSAAPASTAPINVAPVPSLVTSSSSSSSPSPPSAAADTTSSASAYTPPATSSSPPPPTSEAPPPPATTSTPPPPATTSTPPPPATTSTPPPPAVTSASPPAQTSSSSSSSGEPSFMTGTQNGQGTWFQDGLGACGWTNSMSDPIVAVSESLFDSYPGYDGVNPNTNPVCGKYINVNYQGNSVSVKVVDRCTGCSTLDLDMSQTAFGVLANLDVGRIGITWSWA